MTDDPLIPPDDDQPAGWPSGFEWAVLLVAFAALVVLWFA